MDTSMHEILNGLAIARFYAKAMANEVEGTDSEGAATLRRFSGELWNVWDRYKAILPTNKDMNTPEQATGKV
jgi:hypothetical protein